MTAKRRETFHIATPRSSPERGRFGRRRANRRHRRANGGVDGCAVHLSPIQQPRRRRILNDSVTRQHGTTVASSALPRSCRDRARRPRRPSAAPPTLGQKLRPWPSRSTSRRSNALPSGDSAALRTLVAGAPAAHREAAPALPADRRRPARPRAGDADADHPPGGLVPGRLELLDLALPRHRERGAHDDALAAPPPRAPGRGSRPRGARQPPGGQRPPSDDQRGDTKRSRQRARRAGPGRRSTSCPPDTATSSSLHYHQDLGLQEIAARLATTESAVRSRLHRARSRLRAILERSPVAHEIAAA